MKRRFRRLEHILRELGLNDAIQKHNVETRREVQAALFLLQIKQQLGPDETVEDFDLSSQSGYFFKWYGGPYSSRLDETHGQMVSHLHHEREKNSQMVNHLRHEREKNGSFRGGEFANNLLVRSAHDIGRSIQSSPDRPFDDSRDRSLWMRTLATTAYCLAGGWDLNETRRKVSQALGDPWDNFVTDAIWRLDEFGLLDTDDYDLTEHRTPMPA